MYTNLYAVLTKVAGYINADPQVRSKGEKRIRKKEERGKRSLSTHREREREGGRGQRWPATSTLTRKCVSKGEKG